MEVRAMPSSKILRNFTGYLPIVVFAALFYWLVIGVALFYLLRQVTSEETARLISLITSAIPVAVGLVLYVRFVGKRLSQCWMELGEGALSVRGQTSDGLVEKRFPLQDIRLVAVGEPLSRTEQFLDRLNQLGIPKTSMIRVTKDLKAGRLVIQDAQGEETIFHFVDKVFERESFYGLLGELIKSGVAVESRA